MQAQLFDLAADNPGKTVSVRLPDGRFITYTPPRAGALQEPGNPLFFSSSPDVGFVKDGSYVTPAIAAAEDREGSGRNGAILLTGRPPEKVSQVIRVQCRWRLEFAGASSEGGIR